ncbi:MAG: hypothetical protein QXN95_02880 [Candidatus Bathyarchaeia archaeon]
MERKFSKLSSITLAVLLTLSTLLVFVPSGKAEPGTTVEVVDPTDGDHLFYFTSEMIGVGGTFWVNITVRDVTDLQLWQVNVTWDGSLLEYAGHELPADHVFAGAARSMITPTPTIGTGMFVWGCTYINDPYWTFNGTGTLFRLELRVKKGVSQISPKVLECDIQIAGEGESTFLLNGAGYDITFTGVDAHYKYEWVAPPYYPTFFIKPAVCKPEKIGDVFGLEIWVKNVAAGWEIIGFQFSLMWNTTFIVPDPGPTGMYYANGTLLEAFQYYPGGVMYVADINQHNRPPPLTPIPDGYNYSMFGAILLPDSPPAEPYHPPFVSVGPDGARLMTVYFKAIYETISPKEDWTWIEFIDFKFDEDTYALNQYMMAISSSTVDCHYRAPMRILGLKIDLYTQYPSPYGGQGPHMPSDMFAPQELVDLFAKVEYNEYPVQQKLVGFHIIHNGYDIYREATTDQNGIAHVSFRIPWPCENPEDEIFGKWLVIATVEVAQQKVNDTLGFWVWWKVDVLSVEPKHTQYVQRKTGGDPLDFTVIYGTYSMQKLNVTLTVTVYDELGFFIGSDYLQTVVGWGEYIYYDYLACETPPFKTYDPWEPVIPLPTNAVVGKGKVFANAFDKFPWNGGVPYCPEVTNTIDFYIVKPP